MIAHRVKIVPWTIDFIRAHGLREYVRVVWVDANLYRLRNWRCWFGHQWKREYEYEDVYRSAEWDVCERPKCERMVQVWP